MSGTRDFPETERWRVLVLAVLTIAFLNVVLRICIREDGGLAQILVNGAILAMAALFQTYFFGSQHFFGTVIAKISPPEEGFATVYGMPLAAQADASVVNDSLQRAMFRARLAGAVILAIGIAAWRYAPWLRGNLLTLNVVSALFLAFAYRPTFLGWAVAGALINLLAAAPRQGGFGLALVLLAGAEGIFYFALNHRHGLISLHLRRPDREALRVLRGRWLGTAAVAALVAALAWAVTPKEAKRVVPTQANARRQGHIPPSGAPAEFADPTAQVLANDKAVGSGSGGTATGRNDTGNEAGASAGSGESASGASGESGESSGSSGSGGEERSGKTGGEETPGADRRGPRSSRRSGGGFGCSDRSPDSPSPVSGAGRQVSGSRHSSDGDVGKQGGEGADGRPNGTDGKQGGGDGRQVSRAEERAGSNRADPGGEGNGQAGSGQAGSGQAGSSGSKKGPGVANGASTASANPAKSPSPKGGEASRQSLAKLLSQFRMPELPKLPRDKDLLVLLLGTFLLVVLMLFLFRRQRRRQLQRRDARPKSKISEKERRAQARQLLGDALRRALQQPPRTSDERRSLIISLYGLLCDTMATVGLEREASWTPDEFRWRRTNIPKKIEGDLGAVTTTFCRVLYGNQEPSDTETSEFVQAATRIRRGTIVLA